MRTKTFWIAVFLAFLLGVGPPSAEAATNRALAGVNGINNGTITGGDGTGASAFTINTFSGGTAVDSVIAEINPGSVVANTGVSFSIALQPTIISGNTGLDLVTITLPAGYSNILPVSVSIDGTNVPAGTCPTPIGNTQCSSVAGNNLTVTFSNQISSGQSNEVIRVHFTADAPALAGSATFAVSVDDVPTSAPPQSALPGDADTIPANNNLLDVTVTDSLDPFASTLTADPLIVLADGLASSILTATLLDTSGAPLVGETISLTSDRGPLDTLVQPGSTDATGTASGSISSLSPGVSTITGTSSGIPLNQKAQVYFTQGIVLDVSKAADRKDVTIGDVVTYQVEIRNSTTNPVGQVSLTDKLPPNFVYRKGSATLDGNPTADPTGVRTLTFPIGSIPALADGNGNGVADPGEPGYHLLTYQLIVSAGATPGSYTNTAFARDVCANCEISNRAEAEVEVSLDPLFDLGTIIGKVYEDRNGNGWQDRDEAGVAGAMVALDDGTYILTDPQGRYHFPAVTPGQRLLKINLLGLGNGATTTTGETVIAAVTPGLLAKVNFGITYQYQREQIGSGVKYGLSMDTAGGAKPVEIHGSVENHMLLLNGQVIHFPGNDIRLRHSDLKEVVNIVSGELQEPILFLAAPRNGDIPDNWQLSIMDRDETLVKQFAGEGEIEPISWDGKLDSGELLNGGSIYQYQLATEYPDGTRALSPRRLFGVDQTSAIAMSLTGGAFVSGSTELSEAARVALKEASEILRKHPHEKIIIEGHTDSVGSAAVNLALSQKRAAAALTYLTETEGLPEDRFILRWHGEEQPLASNAIKEGRELNRRVEIKGDYQKVERAQLLDQYHTQPRVAINGSGLAPNADGRFHIQADDAGSGQLEITMIDAQGSTLKTGLQVPSCQILQPVGGATFFPFGLDNEETRTVVDKPDSFLDNSGTIIETRLIGRTDPGNTVQYETGSLTVNADGLFAIPLRLKNGTNHIDLLIRNQDNFTRLAGLDLTVATRSASGGHIIYADPIPYLSVQMPPTDKPLNSNVFSISGETTPGNSIHINGYEVSVQTDGHFSKTITLPQGKSPIRIEVNSPEGYHGAIERVAQISDTRLFFLAFADSKVSQLKTSGNIENAGVDSASEVVTEGRLALYLKGTIAGRYLLTAALDTGNGNLDDIFNELDDTGNDRLLTNLDPDKHYPVYGDSSQLVYDTESQGKLYLALEGDELDLLLGNYNLNLNGSELATYQRTLYGGHIVYRSRDKTTYGESKTSIELFGAEVKQQHVRDEIDATGGSLYYLSADDIVEGSEQISIIVRDKVTGLRLANLPQEEGLDYTIKYPEGRLLFRRPVSSVQPDDRLTDSSILAGNPVIIQIDYEARVESFEKSAAGGRLRQQVGDHLAIGGTFVQDDLDSGHYEMWGIDTEIKLGQATRLLAEYAASDGAESAINVSRDGGLSFSTVPQFGTDSGAAWKAAAEIDLGEWVDNPDRYRVSLYHKEIETGFHASGHTREEGTTKDGLLLRLRPTDTDTISARYDLETRDVTTATAIEKLSSATLQWQHQRGRWQLISEYQMNENQTLSGASTDNQFATVRLEYEAGASLVTWLEQQQTLTGVDNDQTSIGVDYRLNSAISLHASATDGSQGQAAEGGISINYGNSRIYLTQRLNESEAERSQSTVIGGEQRATALGKVYSEYQWLQSRNGHRNLSIVGAEKGWDLQPGLHIFLGGEFSESSDGSGEIKRSTLASGFNYSLKDIVRFSSRNEIRHESGTVDRRQILTINKAETALNTSFTLLGLYRFSETENRSGGYNEAGFEEISVGLAWRPTNNDRFNALLRLTRLTDEQPEASGGPVQTETTLETAAVEWSLQINRALEWVEKEALRWKDEAGSTGRFESRSWLSIHRLNLLIQKSIDLGFEYRMLTEDLTDSQKQGWLSEIGWRPKKHFRLGLGYNFTDFSDDERSFNDYSVEGWFIRAQGMY